MNFITFPVDATNIFPASNAESGGQLVTEWNLRSRETVATDPNVTYEIGPSYVHSESDFEVSILTDSGGSLVNNYTLAISEGRGVINGHYVETLAPMVIDLVEANAKLESQSRLPLKGKLAIGIRTFYATDATVAGSILVENEDNMYLGVQLVVLPEAELILPSESPTDKSKVTADIRLATFTFVNNSISVIRNLHEKVEFLSPDRVTKLDDIVSDRYVTKTGLNSKKLYAFAGKGTDPETGYDTWEDVTDSMVVWDSEPVRTTVEPTYKEASFVTTSTGAYLVMPHKQVTGMTTDEGDPEYYQPKILSMPIANYGSDSTGLVSKEYTRQIKQIANEVNDFKTFLNGKQIYFMDVRSESTELPPINDAWNVGDYILVKQDLYYIGGASDTSSAPSTLYAVLPGLVKTIQFIRQVDGDADHDAQIPQNILGTELGYQIWYESAGQAPPETASPEYYPVFFEDDDNIRGIPRNASTSMWVDYFRVRYYKKDSPTYAYTDYFYGVLTSGKRVWSDAVMVTGEVSFATEDLIGGFLNVSEDATDYGYVFLDDTGHLRLMDYQLLRSGTLAYQIASDITVPTSTDFSEIQTYLNEYVNQRIAFPATGSNLTAVPSVLNIYLSLPESDEVVSVEINDIDSRFNTAVCLHIQGTANSNVNINIRDCQKFMIATGIEGSPTINVFRTCLKYDPVIFQYIKSATRDPQLYGNFTGFLDLSMWYEQTSEDDPALLVDGMTVSGLDSQVISAELNYWKELYTAVNDNNYLVALKSITFSGQGDIVGLEVLVANNSTDNIVQGDKIVVSDFVLPQGSNLVYPIACLTRKLKVSGEFTSAYYSDENWYVTNNSFSILTGVYNPYSVDDSMKGTAAFHSVTTLVPSTIPQTSIDAWEPDSYHIFAGGAIS